MQNEVLDGLAELLLKGKFVKEGFLLDVYKRETMGPTLMEGCVAIPHGSPENVIKSAISICILEKPVTWSEEIEVKYVFMLALIEDSKDVLKTLFQAIKERDILAKLSTDMTNEEIRNTFLEYLIVNY